MKIKDVKIGMKVVPFQNTSWPLLSEKEFSLALRKFSYQSYWSISSMIKYDYATVEKIQGKKVLLGNQDCGPGGQWYNPEDFNPFIKQKGKQLLLF